MEVSSDIDNSYDVIANYISSDDGGCFLRRSTWKKLPLWQYATTNLNIHMFTTEATSDEELLSEYHFDSLKGAQGGSGNSADIKPIHRNGQNAASKSSLAANISHFSFLRNMKQRSTYDFNGMHRDVNDDSISSIIGEHHNQVLDFRTQKERDNNEDRIHCIPMITLGVPSAHGLGFKEGGLRKILSCISDPDHLLEWIHGIQAPDVDQIMLLKDKYPQEFEDLFTKKTFQSNINVLFEVLKKKSKLATRLDMCTSQMLGYICTLIRTIVTLAALHPRSVHAETLRVSMKAGWLLTLQSFLSTYSDELGMIEDMATAALWVQGVKMRFVDATKNNSKNSATSLTNLNIWRTASGVLVIDLPLNDPKEVEVVMESNSFWFREDVWTKEHQTKGVDIGDKHGISTATFNETPIDNEFYEKSVKDFPVLCVFDLCCVLFTMGVNEMQTVANGKAKMFTGVVEAQSEINLESLTRLDRHWLRYRDWWTRMFTFQGLSVYGLKTILAVQDLHKDLEHAVHNCVLEPGKKNASIPTAAASFCFKLGGTIGILCKSGKDRTSMSVSLEAARVMVDVHNVIDGKDVVNALRSHGARRMNVWGNTGQPMYAFNSIQRLALPECYRPPLGTYSGSVNS